jgi:hypothetical protein
MKISFGEDPDLPKVGYVHDNDEAGYTIMFVMVWREHAMIMIS